MMTTPTVERQSYSALHVRLIQFDVSSTDRLPVEPTRSGACRFTQTGTGYRVLQQGRYCGGQGIWASGGKLYNPG
jgi:hypothetical protein